MSYSLAVQLKQPGDVVIMNPYVVDPLLRERIYEREPVRELNAEQAVTPAEKIKRLENQENRVLEESEQQAQSVQALLL